MFSKFSSLIFCLLFAASINVMNQHELPPQNWFIEKLFDKLSTTGDNLTISVNDLNELLKQLGVTHFHHDSHQIKSISKDSVYETCYDADDLGEIYTFDNTTAIDLNRFNSLCPALVLMAITPDCTIDEHVHNETCNLSLNKRYLYGSISIIAISAVAFLSIVLVGKFGKIKSLLTSLLTGLALGTLLSDALLHIIPTALGLHDHSDTNHDHKNDNETAHEHSTHVWILTVTMATIIILWFLEGIFDSFDSHGHGHSHSHQNENSDDNEHHNNEKNLKNTENDSLEIGQVEIKNVSFLRSIKSVKAKGWTMFLGDALHNITDGLAIAAAFSGSSSLGFSTSLAILFHEIPHEISSYIILRKSGFTYLGALILNIINALFELTAFFIVTSITGTPSAWLFAITAGVFIYISLGDLMRELGVIFESSKKNKDIKTLLVVICSIVFGWVAMLLLALFEHDISINLDTTCS